MALCRAVLQQHWRGEGVHQVQVTALDPQPVPRQGDLFAAPIATKPHRNAVMDDINRRFGEFTLAPARLLGRSSMPNVIAPAWKPHGHRQSV
jgi:DNA polymerase-4